ncbi:phytoene synthase [Agaricicola taiwanensis]|uniref:Phytoene synthase n=1 Tax=Agaricicola taiwanensis TaxID=591372 RepID=A0A8J2YI90_9RHOB|nr:phytoene/squalene synthase family protein [Agaricicola taiwanensis]GGE44822.1 phytoene synthase [Agaricicola taiwanensis]
MPDISDPCAALVRSADRDRFLATLFAPADRREHLFALYAFNIEIARVRDVVREPLPGEIRLQWWREVIDGARAGEAEAHPIAQRLLATIAANNLPREAFQGVIEARVFDLYNDPMPSLSYLEGYCGETSSALLRLASIILAGGKDPGASDAAGHGGVALGITSVLRAMAFQRQRGQCYLPADVLARHGLSAEEVLAKASPDALREVIKDLCTLIRSHRDRASTELMSDGALLLPAFLPLVLIEGDLRRLEETADPYAPFSPVPGWRRQLTLWRAARRGAI